MKMKIAMLLALIMLCACAAASAQEYYTLPEIREQAAAGWHETYTDKYGRETIVDIDVEVFGADTAPVLKAGFYEDVEYSVELNHPSEALFDAKKRGGETVYAFELRNEKVDLDKKYGEEYGNDLTLREIYAFAEDILKREGIPSESFLYEQPVTFRVKYSANKNNGDIIVPASFDLEILTKKYEMPILSHASESHLNPGYPCYLPYLMISIRSFDEYRIGGQSLKVLEEVIEDIPFCSVTKTIQSIEERIKSGHIQKVYELRNLRFEPYQRVLDAGYTIDRVNYEMMYTGKLTETQDTYDHLNRLFFRFNHHKPDDFRGHSLSVSDIVAIKQKGAISCHYVDRWDFKELPDFLTKENPLKTAEMSVEDDYGMIDGIINNGKSAAEKEKERPSVLAQLKAKPPRQLRKDKPKTRRKEMER